MPKRNSKKTPHKLDSFDKAILRIIQKDNKTPQRKIAESVNLSAAAVQRRIAAMEEAEVIECNVAMVDPYAVQSTITAIVEVYLQEETAVNIDAIKATFRKEPEVQQCYYVTGGTSFVLIVVTTDMSSYESFTRRVFEENKNVSRYRTLVALDRVKTGTAILVS